MIYVKRGITLFFVLLLSVSVALAAHSVTLSADYTSIYETTSQNVSVSVTNSLFSPHSIELVEFLLTNFNVLSIVDIGWESSANGSLLTFSTSTDRIARWDTQTFGFGVQAGNVDDNETVIWTVTTEDTDGDREENTIEITILNDDSAPEISNVVPVDGSFVKEGTADQEFSLTAIDPETGIASVTGRYGLCGNLSNSLSFTNEEDDYYDEENLSGYADEDVICYEFIAKSNGGESAVADGQFTIDGSAPQVQLDFPENGALMNNNSLFQFTATDNLAPALDCSINVDGEEMDSLTATNGEQAEFSVENIPEGEHEWSVTCSDLAGNEGTSGTRNFVLDKTPPVITVLRPENGAVNRAGIPIEVEVTDEHGVAKISYEFLGQLLENITSPFTVNTDDAVDGENLLTVSATDGAGNEAVLNYVMIVDRQPPAIEIISPVENGTFDVHVPLILTVTDNYDPLLDCDVIVDGEVASTIEAENGNLSEETVLINVGQRAVSVRCSDDAENSAQSPTITINVVDLTGPDIYIDEIPTALRGELLKFTATITDFSGVDSATAVLLLPDSSSEPVSLSRNGDVYSGEYQTTSNSPIGDYTFSVTANDTFGSQSTAMESFEVINGYILTLEVTGPHYEGEQVTASGTAQRDDGEAVTENDVTIVLPAGNVTLAIENSSFRTTFSAPSPGTYQVMAYLTVGNRTFDADATLQVNAPSGNSKKSSRSRHSTTVMYLPDDNDSGELDLECVKDSDCEADQKCVDNECVAREKEKLDTARAEPGVNPHSAVNMSNQPGKGIGRAFGFLNLENIRWSSILWIILAVLAMAAVMKMLARRGGRRKRRASNFDLDRYLADRRR